jgi:hypothetical protein
MDIRSNTTHSIKNLDKWIEQEISHVRSLGSDDPLLRASANAGVYEFILLLLSGGEQGMPLYATLDKVRSNYATRSGMIKRISELRKEGLIVARKGSKRSEVYLQPSPEITTKLLAILRRRAETNNSSYTPVSQFKSQANNLIL